MLNTMIIQGEYSTDFSDGITYPVKRLRSLMGAFVTSGVLGANSLRVVPEGEGMYKILPGRAVFSDGGILTVDAQGVLLSGGEGLRYVYLLNSEQPCPILSDCLPEDSCDFILLAQIGEDTTVVDKRTYAKLRV